MERRPDKPRERIGDEERVDRAYEDRQAAARREVYDSERQALEASLRRQREQTPLPERLARIMSQIARFQTRPAGAIARTGSSGKPESGEPPRADQLDGADRHVRMIAAHVRELEHLVDVHQGVTQAKTRQNLTGVEKDRILFGATGEPSEFEGMHSDDVAEAAPYLGSPRTVRRLRAQRGLDIRGRPREER